MPGEVLLPSGFYGSFWCPVHQKTRCPVQVRWNQRAVVCALCSCATAKSRLKVIHLIRCFCLPDTYVDFSDSFSLVLT